MKTVIKVKERHLGHILKECLPSLTNKFLEFFMVDKGMSLEKINEGNYISNFDKTGLKNERLTANAKLLYHNFVSTNA